MAATERPPYTTDEVSALLNKTPPALRAAARRGELPAFKLGRDWRFLPGPIDKLLRIGENAG
jgi:excisionase family DNA binding protein